MSKVCIINTGGTIGMKETDQGLQPSTGFLAEQMDSMDELGHESMPQYDIIEYHPIIDSSNMVPGDWLKIAEDIKANYGNYDGFVVLHGTDTMSYTTSALPFMLGEVNKPIIFTGSQLPLVKVRSDGRENLKTAMLLAANPDIREVCLLFGDQLLRGCRSTKSSADSFDAFESPNYPPLGRIGASIDIDLSRLRKGTPKEENTIEIKPIESHEMATFRLFPGMSNEVLKNVLQRPLKVLLIESYGVGNGPSNNHDFLKTLADANDDGIVLVSCSQCQNAFVRQSAYETGRALMDVGVVSGCDMTLEATIAKVHFLFTNYDSIPKIKQLISTNLFGELTEPNTR